MAAVEPTTTGRWFHGVMELLVGLGALDPLAVPACTRLGRHSVQDDAEDRS
jgi:hypothetical protein